MTSPTRVSPADPVRRAEVRPAGTVDRTGGLRTGGPVRRWCLAVPRYVWDGAVALGRYQPELAASADPEPYSAGECRRTVPAGAGRPATKEGA